MAEKHRKILLIAIASVLTISIIAVAYAYFISNVNVVSNQTVASEVGTMKLVMNDGNTGWSEVWDFGESKTKTFTLQNTGTLPVTVDLYWKNLVNTFLEGSMVYSLQQKTDTNVTTYLVGSATTFESIPTSSTAVSTNKITEEITVPANKTYTYTLTIKLVNSETINQTSDLNAQFYTEFDIREYVSNETNASCFTTTSNGANTVSITNYDHSNCPKDVVIPKKINGKAVTDIGPYAFWGKEITSVILNDNITNISDDAFGCNYITSLEIPSSVTEVGNKAFGCGDGFSDENQLTDLVLNLYDLSLVWHAFNINMNEFNFTINNAGVIPENFMSSIFMGELIWAADLNINLNLANSVTTIGDYAFANSRIKNLVLSNNLVYIGDQAFNSNNIQTLNLPATLTTIGYGAFTNNSISNVTIPSSVNSMHCNAFDDGVNITYQNPSLVCLDE